MNRSPCVVVGTGGMGREAMEVLLAVVEAGAPFEPLGFVDDNPARHGQSIHDLCVLGGLDWLLARPEVGAVVGIGAPVVRARITETLRQNGNPLPTLVHPSATVGRGVILGEGALVCHHVVLTTDLILGRGVIVNVGSVISHDVRVGDFATVNPLTSLSGHVTLGSGVDCGSGVRVIPGVTVGEGTILGAGAVVTRDLPSHVTAVGVPARVIKTRN